MKLGLAGIAVGIPLVGLGIFMIHGGELGLAAYVIGLAALSSGTARMIWAGRRGSGIPWLLAAAPAGALTWVVYELGRQNVPLPGIGILEEMTAPTLSFTVAAILLLAGVFRVARSSRDISQR